MIKRIVWSTDGSPAANHALPVVKQFLASTDASVTVACVHREWHVGHRRVLVDDHRALEQRLQAQVDELNRAGWAADLVLTSNDDGPAAQLIADLAERLDADLIVAGSHGRGPVAGLFLGSFTSNLLKVATRPVLVVPWRPNLDEPVSPS